MPSVIQDEYTSWMQSFPMENEGFIGNNDFFPEISFSESEVWNYLHGKLKRVGEDVSRTSVET